MSLAEQLIDQMCEGSVLPPSWDRIQKKIDKLNTSIEKEKSRPIKGPHPGEVMKARKSIIADLRNDLKQLHRQNINAIKAEIKKNQTKPIKGPHPGEVMKARKSIIADLQRELKRAQSALTGA